MNLIKLKPKVADLYTKQRTLLTTVLADAKKKIAAGETEEGGILLLRVYRGLLKIKHSLNF